MNYQYWSSHRHFRYKNYYQAFQLVKQGRLGVKPIRPGNTLSQCPLMSFYRKLHHKIMPHMALIPTTQRSNIGIQMFPQSWDTGLPVVSQLTSKSKSQKWSREEKRKTCWQHIWLHFHLWDMSMEYICESRSKWIFPILSRIQTSET